MTAPPPASDPNLAPHRLGTEAHLVEIVANLSFITLKLQDMQNKLDAIHEQLNQLNERQTQLAWHVQLNQTDERRLRAARQDGALQRWRGSPSLFQ